MKQLAIGLGVSVGDLIMPLPAFGPRARQELRARYLWDRLYPSLQTVMELATLPRAELAARFLPAPLWRGLSHVFAQGLSDTMLVGGTALAGFYAGHRRSDDLDLFVGTAESTPRRCC